MSELCYATHKTEQFSRVILFGVRKYSQHSSIFQQQQLRFSEDRDDLLQHVIELISRVGVLGVVRNPGVTRHESVLSANIQRVVDLPINISDFPRRMEKALKQTKKLDFAQHRCNANLT